MEHVASTDIDVVGLLSRNNGYDYIIVGSGMGGGPLAEVLAQRKKRVLLIERGRPIFNTHVLNTSRPYFKRGTSNSPEGNETIYDTVKAKVRCTEGSTPYIGGPVYCVGGRSNLWGIWTPQISKPTLETHFPDEIVKYLTEKKTKYTPKGEPYKEDGYDYAFNFMTDNSQRDNIYPKGSGQISSEALEGVKIKLDEALPDSDFDLMPVAAQFNSSSPYMFPQGAYSTTLALMNRMYAHDRYLTVLLDTEVLSIEHSIGPDNKRKVTSILVRHTKEQDKTVKSLEIGDTEVILCAGSIGTASIALNSGLGVLGSLDLVGKGLIDHDVCYVRFAKVKSGGMTMAPVNMKTTYPIAGRTCLVTVTVNANFFLAGSSSSLPTSHYYSRERKPIDVKFGVEDESDFDTICVLFEFVGELNDGNEVLNTPGKDPLIHITRPPLAPEVQTEMEDICAKIRNLFLYDKAEFKTDLPAPRPVQLGFGVFSHECGTMRMDGPKGNGVVDANLRVKSFQNLSVCDLSVFPVSPEANPSLTLMALSLRMANQFAPPVVNPEFPPIGVPQEPPTGDSAVKPGGDKDIIDDIAEEAGKAIDDIAEEAGKVIDEIADTLSKLWPLLE
ncbi:hypothetical protein TWF481_010432 [Arthrobotrys musiformis]|uniref:Glucose-methanol-choline oxidoreductase C-terminal domain-containing protein n=1 Tax=Arthrobotrys musiformis TaxID=47236 RepID=A0AAV9W245_9PEZI